MVEIKITEPEKTPPFVLRLVADLCLRIAAGEQPALGKTPAPAQPAEAQAGWKIAPNDRPDAGTDYSAQGTSVTGTDEPSAATVFGGAASSSHEPDPQTVFGAGNVAGASGTVSFPNNASTSAGSDAAAQGSAPNVPGVLAAPFIAGAVPSSIAPGATPGTSTNQTASAPPAPNGGNAGTAVAASTTAYPVQNGNGVLVDSEGLPWDARIHAGTKTVNKDGRWKVKKGTGETYLIEVKTQLRATMSIPGGAPTGAGQFQTAADLGIVQQTAGNVAPPPPATGAGATPPAAASPSPAPVGAPPAGNAQAPAVGAQPATTPQASQQTTNDAVVFDPATITGFAQLLPAVTQAVTIGVLTQERVQAVLAEYGFTMLPQLAPRNDLVPKVAAKLFGPVQ